MSLIVSEPSLVKKVWGDERWIVNRGEYCGKILTILKDYFCSLHAHKLKLEDFYVQEGRIKLEWQEATFDGGEIVPTGLLHSIVLKRGQSVNIPRLMLHRFTGLCDSNVMIETSTQHFDEDSYRVSPSGRFNWGHREEV